MLRVYNRPRVALRELGPGRRWAEDQRHVWWRRRAEILVEVLAQPTQCKRETHPGWRAQHVRKHSQVEDKGGLASQARPHV